MSAGSCTDGGIGKGDRTRGGNEKKRSQEMDFLEKAPESAVRIIKNIKN